MVGSSSYSGIVHHVLTYLCEDLNTFRVSKLLVYLYESFSSQDIPKSRLEVSTYDVQSDLVVSAQMMQVLYRNLGLSIYPEA